MYIKITFVIVMLHQVVPGNNFGEKSESGCIIKEKNFHLHGAFTKMEGEWLYA